mgnify:CR=1 FL=1
MKHCHFRDDEVRGLERQLDIVPTWSYNPDACRFCEATMYARNVIRHEKSCKAKLQYHTELKKQTNATYGEARCANITNIYNISNCGNNIVNILPFGKENTEFITSDMLVDVMRKALCHIVNEESKSRFIRSTWKLIYGNKDHPENHNMVHKSLKGGTATIWNGKEFEQVCRMEVENKALNTIANVTSDNYWADENKFANYDRFCKRYIVGDEAIDGDDTKAMTKNRNTIMCASYNSKDVTMHTKSKLC